MPQVPLFPKSNVWHFHPPKIKCVPKLLVDYSENLKLGTEVRMFFRPKPCAESNYRHTPFFPMANVWTRVLESNLQWLGACLACLNEGSSHSILGLSDWGSETPSVDIGLSLPQNKLSQQVSHLKLHVIVTIFLKPIIEFLWLVGAKDRERFWLFFFPNLFSPHFFSCVL